MAKIEEISRGRIEPGAIDINIVPEYAGNQDIYVMKFGGTSVGSARRIEGVADIIAQHYRDGKAIILVVSAMSGITNDLIELVENGITQERRDRDIRAIAEKHTNAVSQMKLSPVRKYALQHELGQMFADLRGDAESKDLKGAERRDKILSYGERLSSRLVEARLLERGVRAETVDSTQIIATDDNFGEATPNYERTEQNAKKVLYPLLGLKAIPVVTGFLGSTEDGRFTTLGRNSSDFSASIVGRAIGAKEVWIWTDVDGIYAEDPRANPTASLYDELSFDDAYRMAMDGARVLHTRTFEPLIDTNVILRVKNTMKPNIAGTLVRAHKQ